MDADFCYDRLARGEPGCAPFAELAYLAEAAGRPDVAEAFR